MNKSGGHRWECVADNHDDYNDEDGDDNDDGDADGDDDGDHDDDDGDDNDDDVGWIKVEGPSWRVRCWHKLKQIWQVNFAPTINIHQPGHLIISPLQSNL